MVFFWRWSLTRRGRRERVDCSMKGVPFPQKKSIKIKGLWVGPRGGASPNKTLLSIPRLSGKRTTSGALEVDHFFPEIPTLTGALHLCFNRNVRKVWHNGSQPTATTCVRWCWPLKEYFCTRCDREGGRAGYVMLVSLTTVEIATAGAIWLCACVRYWPYLGVGIVYFSLLCWLKRTEYCNYQTHATQICASLY